VAEIRRFDQNLTTGHRYGITHLSFYPFDSAAFLSSSYDHSLKLWATGAARLSGTFDLGAKIHTHATSPISSRLLVACATQHPAIRLVDLRSAAAVQSLITPGQVGGSTGGNLSVAWSPTHEHCLVSGSSDGSVRIWDIRRASALVGLLDLEDSRGILQRGPDDDTLSTAGYVPGLEALGERGIRTSAKAHEGGVNGLTWSDDGSFIISAGHDAKIRVWDATTGANTLTNFGPHIKNYQPSTLTMFCSPSGLTAVGEEALFFPNETEVLVFAVHEGSMITRLRGMGSANATVRVQSGGERTVRNRLTSLTWRAAGGNGGCAGLTMGGATAAGGLYTGHSDGQIRTWSPQLQGLDDEHEDEAIQGAAEDRASKRKAIDDAYKSLMGKQIRFA
jgi:DNA excision repair protein ERCC-8